MFDLEAGQNGQGGAPFRCGFGKKSTCESAIGSDVELDHEVLLFHRESLALCAATHFAKAKRIIFGDTQCPHPPLQTIILLGSKSSVFLLRIVM